MVTAVSTTYGIKLVFKILNKLCIFYSNKLVAKYYLSEADSNPIKVLEIPIITMLYEIIVTEIRIL